MVTTFKSCQNGTSVIQGTSIKIVTEKIPKGKESFVERV
jgi:hypothetical protein